MFAESLQNKKIILHTDNETLVTILNRQTSKHPQTLVLLKDIVLQAMTHNIIFRAEHIPGLQNTLAEPVSQLQVNLFMSRA